MGVEGTLSLRESLEEAFDEAEETADEKEEKGEEQAQAQAQEQEQQNEQEHKQESADDTGIRAKEGEATSGDGEKGGEEEGVDKEAEAITDAIKVPNGWRANAKEVWDKVPAAAQAEIKRRENDIGRISNESAEYRKSAESFTSVVQPFLPNIQAEGVSPPEAIQNLLQTAASLQMGSALVKAQTITRLIGAYGVDIQTLSDLLTDTYKPTEEDRVNQAVDARMRPYNEQQARLSQQTTYDEQQSRETIRAETNAWSEKAEFVKEVGTDMADLLEMAGNRGQSLTLDEAYGKACMMNESVRKILNQREAAARAKENVKVNLKKKRAGSSVTGSPGGGKPGAMQPSTIRESLNAAWDEAEGH